MPIYEFSCSQCGTEFEELIRGDARPACPGCGSGDVRRLLSTFAVHSSTADLGGKASGKSCSTCSGSCCATCH